MPKGKKIWRVLAWIFGVIGLLILVFIIYMLIVSKTSPPTIKDKTALSWQRTEPVPGLYTLNNNWFRKSKSGLYELIR